MKTIVMDCETTGLTVPSILPTERQPKIIELALAVIHDGALRERHTWLIDPGEPITDEITKITGITNDDVRGQPKFAAIVGQVADVFAGTDQLIAHNAPFDWACLEYELKRAKVAKFPMPGAIICTVQEYVHEFGHRPRLIELYERKIGKPLDQTHRAMDDVDALVEIVLKEGLA